MSEARDQVCGGQADHEWVGDPQKCCKCGISWLDSVRGFGLKTSNFSMPSKSFRHKRVIDALSGGQQE